MTIYFFLNAILLFGIAIFTICAIGLYTPKQLIKYAQRIWSYKWSITVAVLIRLLFGLMLISVADHTEFPQTMQILGYLTIAAAAILPLLGRQRIAELLDWISKIPAMGIRLWLALGMLFGAFLIYAVQ